MSSPKVKKLTEKQLLKLELEQQRLFEMSSYERQYASEAFIAGVDEVGRGPLAGPVVVAAVILPKDTTILYLNDSKKLSEKKRLLVFDEIKEKAIGIGIGIVNNEVIDEINILQATYMAMKKAIVDLPTQPTLLLNDAVTIPDISIKQVPIVKGDSKSISIAAASVVAKVTRDLMMVEYDKIYPGYGFASNKGYGSKAHMEALKQFGKTKIHRDTFIRNII